MFTHNDTITIQEKKEKEFWYISLELSRKTIPTDEKRFLLTIFILWFIGK